MSSDSGGGEKRTGGGKQDRTGKRNLNAIRAHEREWRRYMSFVERGILDPPDPPLQVNDLLPAETEKNHDTPV